MKNYNWNYPTTMWVGENRIKDLSLACKTLNMKNPLFVTDSSLASSEIVKKTLESLNNENLNPEIYSKVSGNPTGSNVNEGVAFYKKKNWDQPIIVQKEIGILGILKKNNKYLLQAKFEPGNINKIQISPTVQATKSNYTQVHGGKKVPFLNYFLKLLLQYYRH